MPRAGMSRSRSNLPAEVTTFVGRRHELTAAKQLFSHSRLLTLCGIGGVGKTRLARRVAAEVQRAFPDGVWQVELADLTDPALLGHEVAFTLGLKDPSSDSGTARLIDYLVDKRLLLLLDNCEHLIDACAEMVDALLRGCPELHVLATSRQPLGISGESILTVSPLPVPDPDRGWSASSGYDSVQLLVDRARAARPGFTVTDENRRVVSALCWRLEGVPLAIEMAATRLRTLSADEILIRLEDRFGLLTGGSRSASARQRNMRALVDWSYHLCTDSEQELWSCLSVFAGGIRLKAIEGVCAQTRLAEHDVLELVAGLVDKSIVTRDERGGVTSYRMIDLIRQYGLRRLTESGQLVAATRRHRDWYAGQAARAYAEWFGPEQLTWYQRIRAEHPNFRAALEYCLTQPEGAGQATQMVADLIDCWIAVGYLPEARKWLDQALGQSGQADPVRARGLQLASYVALLQGDLPPAEAMLRESTDLARQAEDAHTLAWITFTSALAALLRRDLATADRLYQDARDQALAVGDQHALISTCCGWAMAGALRGDIEGSKARLNEIFAAAGRDERWAQSYVLLSLGIAQWSAGQREDARELILRAISLKEPFDDRLGLALCVDVLAWITAAGDRLIEAAQLLGSAEEALASIGTSVAAFGYVVAHHQACEAALRQTLGDAEFDEAFQNGRHLTYQATMAIASNAEAVASQGQRLTVDGPDMSPLTRREAEIAQLIAQGHSNKTIASALVISQRTAEGHVEHILSKLGFTSRAQIAAWVTERCAPHDQ